MLQTRNIFHVFVSIEYEKKDSNNDPLFLTRDSREFL